MTFFRDRYQGVGAIAADAPAPRSAPAPTIQRILSRDYANVPELEKPLHEYEKGRSFVSMPARVKVVRGSGQRGPLLLSGIRPGSPPISEVERRVAPRPLGSRIPGGPRSLMKRGSRGARTTLSGTLQDKGGNTSKPMARNLLLQIGTGIGTPSARGDAPATAIMVAQPDPGSPTGWSTQIDNETNNPLPPGTPTQTVTDDQGYTYCGDGSKVLIGTACPPIPLKPPPGPVSPPAPSPTVIVSPPAPVNDQGFTITCPDGSKVGPGMMCPSIVQVAPTDSGSSSLMPILLIGGGALALYLLFRKKQP